MSKYEAYYKAQWGYRRGGGSTVLPKLVSFNGFYFFDVLKFITHLKSKFCMKLEKMCPKNER